MKIDLCPFDEKSVPKYDSDLKLFRQRERFKCWNLTATSMGSEDPILLNISNRERWVYLIVCEIQSAFIHLHKILEMNSHVALKEAFSLKQPSRLLKAIICNTKSVIQHCLP